MVGIGTRGPEMKGGAEGGDNSFSSPPSPFQNVGVGVGVSLVSLTL